MGMARGAIYLGTFAAPAIDTYQKGGGMNALTYYGGYDLNQGNFAWKRVTHHLAPFAAWSAIDFGLSRFGVYKRAGAAMRSLGI